MKSPIVFLPGMMCDARLFSSQLAALSFDRSIHVSNITGASTMEAIAKEVLATSPSEFVLCGLSMGGIVAMEVVRQAPGRVKGLILMDTNARAETEEVQRLRQPQIDEVRNGGLQRIMLEKMIPRYLHFKDEEIEQLCLDMALRLGEEAFVRQSEALRDRPDQQEALKQVTCPALILCGENDVLCPLDRHTLLNSLLQNSELIVLERCGHLPTLEFPAETNSHIARWLKEMSL